MSPMSPDSESATPPSFACVVRLPSTSISPIDRSASPSDVEPEQQPRRDRFLKSHFNTLFEKSNFCPKNSSLTKPQHFSPKFLLTIFLVKSKLSTAKKSKTTIFSRVFHPRKKIDNFLGKSKLNFWTKNEDFEQREYTVDFDRMAGNL